MYEFVNGDHVQIVRGPQAGLTGLIGATRPDGWVEVIMPDLTGPASEAEEFHDPADLVLLKD